MDNFYLGLVDGDIQLATSHDYYFQVQGQLGVTGRKWGDFFVYTQKGFHLERIPINKELSINLKPFGSFCPNSLQQFDVLRDTAFI